MFDDHVTLSFSQRCCLTFLYRKGSLQFSYKKILSYGHGKCLSWRVVGYCVSLLYTSLSVQCTYSTVVYCCISVMYSHTIDWSCQWWATCIVWPRVISNAIYEIIIRITTVSKENYYVMCDFLLSYKPQHVCASSSVTIQLIVFDNNLNDMRYSTSQWSS